MCCGTGLEGWRREGMGQMLLLLQKCIPDKMICQVDDLQSCYYTVTFLLINDKSMSYSRKESPDNSVTVDNMTASLPVAYDWRPEFGLKPAGYKRVGINETGFFEG